MKKGSKGGRRGVIKRAEGGDEGRRGRDGGRKEWRRQKVEDGSNGGEKKGKSEVIEEGMERREWMEKGRGGGGHNGRGRDPPLQVQRLRKLGMWFSRSTERASARLETLCKKQQLSWCACGDTE
jgi:hypothetical protein